jgi:twitching motility protein PilT
MDAGMFGLIAAARDQHASDLHVDPAFGAALRVDARVRRLPDVAIASETIDAFLDTCLDRLARARFDAIGIADVAYHASDVGAIRIHASRGRRGSRLAIRLLAQAVPELETLNLPPFISGLCDLNRGLALFCGPPGSGKTTTVAALVDRANKTSARHIVAYETPIEYVHVWQRSIVTQYEVGRDVSSFAEGVRGALRCDPNLVVIGEMKEADTAEAALAAAEAGHVVFATLHTPSETSYAVNRIVGLFPAGEHDRVRGRLAEVMHSIVALRLLPLRGGRGLRPATEILVVTDGVRRHLRDGSLHQIRSLLSSSRQDGSQTLERDLDDLVAGGYIEHADALAAANYPSELAVPAALRPSRAW